MYTYSKVRNTFQEAIFMDDGRRFELKRLDHEMRLDVIALLPLTGWHCGDNMLVGTFNSS